MSSHADKSPEPNGKVGSKKSSEASSFSRTGFHIEDNHPEAAIQRKLQELANNSPQAIQMKALQEMAASSPQAKQAAQLQEMANNSPQVRQLIAIQEMVSASPQAKQAAQLQEMANNYSAGTFQKKEDKETELMQGKHSPVQRQENKTGLPDTLKAGVESLSGFSMDDVKVHYNSAKPAELQAHAYAKGTDIHLASGQEKHLPHEAWHVVQQKQGRVKPTMQTKGKVPVNDDADLEKEADVMGAKAAAIHTPPTADQVQLKSETGGTVQTVNTEPVAQRVILLQYDGTNDIVYTKQTADRPPGCLPGGKQGDHTTPFTVLQNQIANAIEECGLNDAWDNLKDTFSVYKTLPGWAETRKGDLDIYDPLLTGLFNSKGDINALQQAVLAMLELRNKIEFTSLPKGHGGNGEGTWAGSLQYQERQFQLGNKPVLKKNEVLGYMWKAFDHGRANTLGDTKKAKIVRQHAITITDAYPMVSQSVGLDANAVESAYSSAWENWTPPQ